MPSYQEANHNNIVLANGGRGWGELRGTCDKGGESFHGAACELLACWLLVVSGQQKPAVYVCEAAIDAMPYLFMKLIEKKKSKNRLFMCQSAA